MAITFVEKQKKERKQLLFAVLALIITGVVVWWGFFREIPNILEDGSLIIPKNQVKINFDIFKKH